MYVPGLQFARLSLLIGCHSDSMFCIIMRQHHVHAVHRCGLLLQMLYIAWCVLGIMVNCAKPSEPVWMPFEGQTCMGPVRFDIPHGTFEGAG